MASLPDSKRRKIGASDHIPKCMDPDLREELECIVKECMRSFDASHDSAHVLRVRNMAIEIAKAEGVLDLELVEMAALLHDVNDHKYITKDHHSKQNNDKINAILAKYNIATSKVEAMNAIIDSMSFSKEIKLKHSENEQEYTDYLSLFESRPEMGCVQDADRLDAIGSIGIARTFCFGGSRGRSLFNCPVPRNRECPTDRVRQWIEDGKSGDSTIGHFYDKLLVLRDMMKTATGKQMASKRHEIMVLFLRSFLEEWGAKETDAKQTVSQ